MEYDSVCSICDKKYIYNRSKGHTKTKCGSCSVNQRRFALKIKCVEYKGGKCIRCGYSKCNRALCFHHKDPNGKDFGIGGKHCLSWANIQKELDKCDLVCANCHAEIHEEMPH